MRFQLLPLRENSSHTQNDLDSNKDKDDKGPLWLVSFAVVILIVKYVIFRKYYLSIHKSDTSQQNDSGQSENSDSMWLLKYYCNRYKW